MDVDEFRRFLATKPERSAIEWVAREAVRLGKATQWELRDVAQGDTIAAAAIEAAFKTGSPKTGGLDLIPADDVAVEPTDWLWKGHLARGALELSTGVPGLGKSQVQIALIACITRGLSWPNGDPVTQQGRVIMITAEDALSQTVKPRLVAANADCSKIDILRCIKTDDKKRQFLLAEDLDLLEREILRRGDIVLVTIDPITAYMGGKIDSHKTTEVRAQLGPLKDFAERTRVAVSAITHPPKGGGNAKAIDQFIGSQAFIAAARIGHQCVPEMRDENGVMKPTGRAFYTNAKPAPQHTRMPTLVYHIGSTIVGTDPLLGNIFSPFIVWEDDASDLTPDQALAAAAGLSSRGQSQKRVQEFLKEMLAGGRPVEMKVIEEFGIRRGITKDQLRTARSKLRVASRKRTGDGVWEWLYERDYQAELGDDDFPI